MKTVQFRGRPACTCLAEWLRVFEQELLDLGLIKYSIDITQLIGDYSKSAGTHAGGAFDVMQYSDAVLKVARQMGAAMWHRTPPAFIHHGHGVLSGCPHLAGPAYRQVVSLNAGNNGLANGGRDDGPRAGVQFPLRTWEQGVAWAKKRQAKRRGVKAKVAMWVSLKTIRAQAKPGAKVKKKGSVRRVQKSLNRVYTLKLTTDGKWGAATRAAYVKHQDGLDLEGLPGSKSLSILLKRDGNRYRLVK